MIAVLVKWVDLHPEIDLLTGEVSLDDRRRGFSSSDQAALEVALRLAEERSTAVTVVSLAPAAAEPALRELAASGASALVRIDGDDHATSADVGAALASVLGDAELILAGDHSLDRGSGSVPAFVAHQLGRSQALGLIGVGGGAPLSAVRRLDGGRREHVTIDGPAVISVEGSVARLRRASMRQVLAARELALTVVPATASHALPADPPEPIRPRARALPAPAGDRALQRIVELTGALVERTPPRRLEATPPEAAVAIVEQLRTWGYVE